MENFQTTIPERERLSGSPRVRSSAARPPGVKRSTRARGGLGAAMRSLRGWGSPWGFGVPGGSDRRGGLRFDADDPTVANFEHEVYLFRAGSIVMRYRACLAPPQLATEAVKRRHVERYGFANNHASNSCGVSPNRMKFPS